MNDKASATAMWLQVFGEPLNWTLYMFFTVVCGARDRIRASHVCLASTPSTTELHSQPCVLLRCPTVVQILSVLCSLQNSRHSGMFKQWRGIKNSQSVPRDSSITFKMLCVRIRGNTSKTYYTGIIIIDLSNIISTHMTYIFCFVLEMRK